jgi:hypothetical protein
MTTTSTTSPNPEAAATVTCTRAFWADRHTQYTFVFTIPGTQQRFTVYTSNPYRYEIGATYTVTLTAAAAPPGPATPGNGPHDEPPRGPGQDLHPSGDGPGPVDQRRLPAVCSRLGAQDPVCVPWPVDLHVRLHPRDPMSGDRTGCLVLRLRGGLRAVNCRSANPHPQVEASDTDDQVIALAITYSEARQHPTNRPSTRPAEGSDC